MRRTPRNDEPERDRAGMGDDDVEIGGFGDDRGIAGHAAADRRQRPLPAILLAGHERDDELATQPPVRTARDDRPDRGEDRRHAALHVARSAAEETAVADHAGPWIDRPGFAVARRHHVEMPRQHDPAPARRANSADDEREAAALGLLARPGRVGANGGEVGNERLDVHARRRKPGRHLGLDRLLRSGQARDADEVGQFGCRGARIDRSDDAPLVAGQRAEFAGHGHAPSIGSRRDPAAKRPGGGSRTGIRHVPSDERARAARAAGGTPT
jgi:hypothetical protein